MTYVRMVWSAVIALGWTVASSAQTSRVAAAAPERAVMEARRITVQLDNEPLVMALHAIAREAGLRAMYNDAVIPSQRRVTLHSRQVAVREAFQEVLRGTGLVAQVRATGNVTITREVENVVTAGVITGRVTDAKTKQPIRGAQIGLDDVGRVAETGEDGGYHIDGVRAGSHTVTVKRLGYAKAIRSVVVQDEATASVDVLLELSAMALDQVVVTGTVIQTELKAVPNAMTVITAKQMEERGITKINQLFRGDIPGLFAQNRGSADALDEVAMFSRGATALSGMSAGVDAYIGTTNPIKTYVDGIELADPKYLSQIDPKSIERIEILTGPQASTIYGSNAINGVMQIFTKRGSTVRPQVTLNLLSGFVQNNFSSALTPQHDYSAQLSGLEGRLSYNAGASWSYMGPWTPAKQLARTGGFGGTRLELPTSAGQVTADLTLRRTLTQNLQRGDSRQPLAAYRETGWYSTTGVSGVAAPTTRTLAGQTIGLTLSYAPASWWSHELGLGQDVSDMEQRYTAREYISIDDTTLFLQQSHTDRRSQRYATTTRIPITSLAQLTVTTGADSWQNLMYSLSLSPQTLTGSLTNVTDIRRQPGHNTGGFLQTQLGLKDRLFFTYGFRAEWNPDYGKNAEPNYSPRYGVAYTQELGPMTAKLRASYGRSTRPPRPDDKTGLTVADAYGSSWSSASSQFLPYYGGIVDYRLANPDLAPEHQQGGEGGLELYLGTRGSLVITRYNQTVDGLIAQPVVDSVRTLVPCNAFSPGCSSYSLDPQGYGYWLQSQYLNVGSIRNQGWELQGSLNIGPLTTRGTYSWTKSRTIGVNPKYRAYFANQSQYTPGATFQFFPEHTWALGVTYSKASSSVGFNLTGTGQATVAFDEFYYQNISSAIRLPQNRRKISNTSGYINFNAPYALADITASHRFAPGVEGILQAQNLTNRYINDYWAVYASLGRQVKLGGRVRTW